MFKKYFAVFSIAVLTAILYVSAAHAETTLKYGAAFRLRQEIWDDVVGLDVTRTGASADRSFFRLRTQLWGQADFSKDFDAYLRLTNEMQYHVGPYRPNAEGDKFFEDEVVVDNLYFDARNVFGLPVDLRIGRQDFLGPNTYGEGFLIMDGTPGDGSRTFFFNAAKATVKINAQNSVDLLYLTDTQTDTYLPIMFGGTKRVLNTSNEQGFVVYGRSKVTNNVTLEPYYMYKTEQAFGTTPKLKLNTVGARAVVGINGGWKVGGEYAHQFGDYSDGGKWDDRTGNGGYIFVGRKYENVGLQPEFDLRYVYLSGDDTGTADKNEGWDPLFSRNPYWNELIIYTLIPEQGVAGYWTNMEILKATVKLNFSPQTSLALAYQYLWAPEKSGLTSAMFGTGKERGHLPTAILTHSFSKNLDAMVQLEYFIPGSFYSDQADNATFFRWQLQYRM